MNQAKILIVDDKQANLVSLRAVLATYMDDEGGSIDVCEADSGEKGLQILLKEKIDLILLDVQMPVMDGYETARIIGLSKRTNSIPIIFLSAVYNDEVHMVRGYQGGAIDFISKPINPEILKAKVGNFLRVQRAINRAITAEKKQEAILEASRLKTQFLMNMNHELRTPMNGILGMVEILMDNEALSQDQRECLETIQQSGEQMLRIVENVLDIASLEADRMEIVPKAFHFRQLVNEVISLYRFQIEKKELEMEVKIDPFFTMELLGDAQRIKQVIMNLLSNAVKFTEHGMISLTVAFDQLVGQQVLVEITVQDTGSGIEAAKKPLLFQLFSQGDAETTKKHQGLGLGLVIVQRLVSLMHGEIIWDSHHGKGSWFTVKLPLAVVAKEETGLAEERKRAMASNELMAR